MARKPAKYSAKKGLSAHESGKVAPHGKATEDVDLSPKLADPLTDREEEVIALVAENLDDEDIGKSLNIKESTVEKHLEHIYPKVGANTRASAAIWFLRRQLEAARKENTILKQMLARQGGSAAASSDQTQ